MSSPMMKCGHAANGKKGDQPVCVICAGLRPGWDEVGEQPNLTGRVAMCVCKATAPSSNGLAFFSYAPQHEFDEFYCGHAGWD